MKMYGKKLLSRILSVLLLSLPAAGSAGTWQPENRACGKVTVEGSRVILSADTQPEPPVSAAMELDAAQLQNANGIHGTVLKLQVNTHGDPGIHFRYGIEFISGGKVVKKAVSGIESSYFGWTDKTLSFTLPEEEFQKAKVFVELLTGGTLSADAVKFSAAAGRNVPVAVDNSFCRITGLPPRRTCILPEIPRNLTVEHCVPAGELLISLAEIGKADDIMTWKKSGGNGTVQLELPPLPAGAYKVTCSWQGGRDVEFFRIRTAQSKGVTFDREHRMRLDGEPFFPIGAYTSILTEEMLHVYHQAGFNTAVIRGHADTPENRYYAGKINDLNMAAVITTRLGANINTVNAAKEVDEVLRFASKFDRFIGISADELCWGKASLEKVRNFYELFFAAAPDHIVWQNHAPRMTGNDSRSSFAAVRRFSRLSEVTGVDIYPVPGGRHSHNNLPDKNLACVGRFTELAARSIWYEKPVWMILQAFSWDEYGNRPVKANPLPDFSELRFMVWDAVVHGARGIFWYHPLRTRMVWFTEFGKYLTGVNREIAAHGVVIAAGDRLKLPEAPEHIVWAGFEYAGQRLFIAVNESPERSVSFKLPLPGKYFVSPAGTLLESDTVTLGAYGVLIVTSRPVKIAPAEIPPRRFSDAELTIHGEWVAHPQFVKTPRKKVFFRQEFTLPEQVSGRGILQVTADEEVTLEINGIPVPFKFDSKRTLFQADVSGYLKGGKNVISGTLYNAGGVAGVIFSVSACGVTAASGKATLFSENGTGNWQPAYSHGASPVKPWFLPAGIFDLGIPGRSEPAELHSAAEQKEK